MKFKEERTLETRSLPAVLNLKGMKEKRATLAQEIRTLLESSIVETRGLTEDEASTYNTKNTEIRNLDDTIKLIEENISSSVTPTDEITTEQRELEQRELETFEQFIRNTVREDRSAVNMTKGSNGAVIPKTIANKILSKVYEMSPILEKATKFNTKGTLSFPVYDETTNAIIVGYQSEFSALVSSVGSFSTVDLTGFLAGALAKISMSLINNNDINIVDYVIGKMSEAVKRFLEKELIVGTSSKMTGAYSSTNVITTASSIAITADELIDLEMEINSAYNNDAMFIMTKTTLKSLRKLKNSDGEYLLTKSLVDGFKYSLLGHPVYLTDNMDEIGAGKTAIVYGDFSGMYVKYGEELNITVMREKFLDEHAVGVIAWLEADSKIVEPQKIAILKNK